MTKRASGNYGIQAETVQADAIAAGNRARATITKELHQEKALDALQDAMRRLTLDETRQQAILSDVNSSKTVEPSASIFDKVVSAPKTLGRVTELVEPLKAVARAASPRSAECLAVARGK
jgi:hypothetical protein